MMNSVQEQENIYSDILDPALQKDIELIISTINGGTCCTMVWHLGLNGSTPAILRGFTADAVSTGVHEKYAATRFNGVSNIDVCIALGYRQSARLTPDLASRINNQWVAWIPPMQVKDVFGSNQPVVDPHVRFLYGLPPTPQPILYVTFNYGAPRHNLPILTAAVVEATKSNIIPCDLSDSQIVALNSAMPTIYEDYMSRYKYSRTTKNFEPFFMWPI